METTKNLSGLDEFKKSKHFVSFSKGSLIENEEILGVLQGYIGKMMGTGEDKQYNGLLFCTNKTLAFHSKGFIRSVSRSIPIEKLSSIDVDKGVVFTKIAFHTSNDDITFNCGEDYELIKAFKLLVEEIRDKDNSSSNIPIKGVSDDPIGKIRKLSELKNDGIITEEEFERQKKDLLNRI